jgi:predicted ester cyclase
VPHGEDYGGREAVKEWVRGFLEEFPDAEVELDDVIVGEGRIVTPYTVRGTYDGELRSLGTEPTDRTVEFSGVAIHAMDGENATEAWWYYDRLGILAQFGALPEDATA